jgi:hypothetical protein
LNVVAIVCDGVFIHEETIKTSKQLMHTLNSSTIILFAQMQNIQSPIDKKFTILYTASEANMNKLKDTDTEYILLPPISCPDT